ncbi:hypothetical protein ABLN67_10020, partial [Mycobacterium tuberculosis]
CTSFDSMQVFNRFIYRREWFFAFIVKRFRVFRAPLHRRYKPIWALMRRKCRHVCTRSGYCRLVCRSARAHHVVVRR